VEGEQSTIQAIRGSQEGRILYLGLALIGALLVVVLFFLVIDPPVARTLVFAFFAHSMGGRAAGIGLCIATDYGRIFTIAYNFYIELALVFVSYASFVLTLKHYINFKYLSIAVKNAEKKAHKHEKIISRFGWAGLFIFVMVPFPLTGPVLGSFMGYLIKMKMRSIFSAVFSGTLAAIVMWTYFFSYLDKGLHIFKYVFAVIIAFVVIFSFKSLKGWFTKEIQD